MTEIRKTTHNLEERTAKFGGVVIDFCKKIKQGALTRSLIDQLVRSGTSIGANYMEANDAVSKRLNNSNFIRNSKLKIQNYS